MPRRSNYDQHAELNALRAGFRRAVWATRFLRLVVALACFAVLDLLSQRYMPELRNDVVEVVAAWIRQNLRSVK